MFPLFRAYSFSLMFCLCCLLYTFVCFESKTRAMEQPFSNGPCKCRCNAAIYFCVLPIMRPTYLNGKSMVVCGCLINRILLQLLSAVIIKPISSSSHSEAHSEKVIDSLLVLGNFTIVRKSKSTYKDCFAIDSWVIIDLFNCLCYQQNLQVIGM